MLFKRRYVLTLQSDLPDISTDKVISENKKIPRGWPLYIWVYEDFNPKMGKILDFREIFWFFQDFLIFWTLFGLFSKKIRIFSCFRGFWTFFRPNFLDFLDFFRIFGIFGIDFLGCTKTFLSGQPLGKYTHLGHTRALPIRHCPAHSTWIARSHEEIVTASFRFQRRGFSAVWASKRTMSLEKVQCIRQRVPIVNISTLCPL